MDLMLRRFFGATDGNIAMLTGLTAIPLVLVLGMAIDFQRAGTSDVHISNALDAALIAAAVDLANGADATAAKATGEKVFDENMTLLGIANTCADPVFTPDIVNQSISGSVSCDMPLTISKLVGRDTMTVTPTAAAAYGSDDIEVALMLDVSGSMRGQRLTDL
ncbi:MAG: pilus assembly protein TadG-related protein, partial [Pseudomonadota bacterium]